MIFVAEGILFIAGILFFITEPNGLRYLGALMALAALTTFVGLMRSRFR